MRWARPFFSSRKTLHVGLDINSVALSLVALSGLDGCYTVQAYGQELLPEHVILGHHVQDISALSQCIRNLLIQLNLDSQTNVELHAAIAVPDACTFHKTIQVSERLQDADIEDLVSIELTKCIPDSLNDIYYDFKSIGNTVQPGMRELLIVAARANYIQDRVTALRSAGLVTSSVEIESFAIQRILPFMPSIHKALGVSVILDLSPQVIKAFFFREDSLLFVHEEELSQSLNQKNNYQEEMLQRFKRACHFLNAKYAFNEPLSMIILSGMEAQNPNRLSYLQKYYDCPIYCANPFTTIKIAGEYDQQQLEKEAALYLIATGLAKRVC